MCVGLCLKKHHVASCTHASRSWCYTHNTSVSSKGWHYPSSAAVLELYGNSFCANWISTHYQTKNLHDIHFSKVIIIQCWKIPRDLHSCSLDSSKVVGTKKQILIIHGPMNQIVVLFSFVCLYMTFFQFDHHRDNPYIVIFLPSPNHVYSEVMTWWLCVKKTSQHCQKIGQSCTHRPILVVLYCTLNESFIWSQFWMLVFLVRQWTVTWLWSDARSGPYGRDEAELHWSPGQWSHPFTCE